MSTLDPSLAPSPYLIGNHPLLHSTPSYTPPYTATVVSRCLDEGAILVGKSNMDEFALGSASLDGCYARVRNPWPHHRNRLLSLSRDQGY